MQKYPFSSLNKKRDLLKAKLNRDAAPRRKNNSHRLTFRFFFPLCNKFLKKGLNSLWSLFANYKWLTLLATLNYIFWWSLQWWLGLCMNLNLCMGGLALFTLELFLLKFKGGADFLSALRLASMPKLLTFKTYPLYARYVNSYVRELAYGYKQPEAARRSIFMLFLSLWGIAMVLTNLAQLGVYLKLLLFGALPTSRTDFIFVIQAYVWPSDLQNLFFFNVGFTLPWVVSLAAFLGCLYLAPARFSLRSILGVRHVFYLFGVAGFYTAYASMKASLGLTLADHFSTESPILFWALVGLESLALLINLFSSLFWFQKFKRSPVGFYVRTVLKLTKYLLEADINTPGANPVNKYRRAVKNWSRVTCLNTWFFLFISQNIFLIFLSLILLYVPGFIL